MASEEEDLDDWEDYSSEQMFPGCDCGHDATEHKACWGDNREGEGCLIPGCPCEVEWGAYMNWKVWDDGREPLLEGTEEDVKNYFLGTCGYNDAAYIQDPDGNEFSYDRQNGVWVQQ